MTQNIEQRTEVAVKKYEGASDTVDKFAHLDGNVSTNAGARKSFPKISREWDEESERLKKEWNNDSTTIREDWQNERNELSTKALGVKPWEAGQSETNVNQQRRWNDNHTYLPKSVPAVMDVSGPDDNWIPYTADKSGTLNDVFGRKPIDLVEGITLTPDAYKKYPKLNAFGLLWEVEDGENQIVVSSFSQTSNGTLQIQESGGDIIEGFLQIGASQKWVKTIAVFKVSSVSSMLELEPSDGDTCMTKSYIVGKKYGAASYTYDESLPQSLHNGVTILAKDIHFPGNVVDYFSLRGEEGQFGCWVLNSMNVDVTQAGALPESGYNNAPSFNQVKIACQAHGKTIVSNGLEYEIHQNVDWRLVDVQVAATILTVNQSCLILGGNASSRINKKQWVQACYPVEGIWTADVNVPDICIKGAKGQSVEVNSYGTLLFYADNSDVKDNYSIAYSRYTLDGGVYLILDSDGPTEANPSAFPGWINENQFFLMRLSGFISRGAYSHNNNRLYGGTLEGKEAFIHFEKGSNNRWFDLRAENVSEKMIKFSQGTYNNSIELSWTSSDSVWPSLPPSAVEDLGESNIVSATVSAYYDRHPILMLAPSTLLMDDDQLPTKYNLANVMNITKRSTDLVVTAWQYMYESDFIPVSLSGDSWINVESHATVGGFRFEVHGYDENFNPLSPAAGDMYVRGTGLIPFGDTAQSNATAMNVVVKNRRCRWVKVKARCGNVAETTFKIFQISLLSPMFSPDGGAGFIPAFNTPSI